MKDKVFAFIIGFLIGAIITTSGFLIYQKVNRGNHQMPNNRQMEMMEGPDGQTKRERPSGMENDETRHKENNGKKSQEKEKNNTSVNDETI